MGWYLNKGFNVSTHSFVITGTEGLGSEDILLQRVVHLEAVYVHGRDRLRYTLHSVPQRTGESGE